MSLSDPTAYLCLFLRMKSRFQHFRTDTQGHQICICSYNELLPFLHQPIKWNSDEVISEPIEALSGAIGLKLPETRIPQ